MVLIAGLTPAWQQILVFDRLVPGEVNRAREAVWCASGKVLNVGIAAHHLGGASMTLSPLGGPALGPVSGEFDALGVPHRWIVTRAPTRVCTTVLDRATGSTTELVENGRPLEVAELDAFLSGCVEEAKKAGVVVITGSLPEGTPRSYYRSMLERMRCPAVLDFRGEGLLSVLDLEPLVVKPNRQELSATIGRPIDTDDDLLAGIRALHKRGARWVVVTQGAGPVWVASDTEVHRMMPLKLESPVNPIASGDAMAGAIAWAVREGRAVPDAVRLGIAAAGQNARQLLPCRLNPATLENEAARVTADRVVA